MSQKNALRATDDAWSDLEPIWNLTEWAEVAKGDAVRSEVKEAFGGAVGGGVQKWPDTVEFTLSGPPFPDQLAPHIAYGPDGRRYRVRFPGPLREIEKKKTYRYTAHVSPVALPAKR